MFSVSIRASLSLLWHAWRDTKSPWAIVSNISHPPPSSPSHKKAATRFSTRLTHIVYLARSQAIWIRREIERKGRERGNIISSSSSTSLTSNHFLPAVWWSFDRALYHNRKLAAHLSLKKSLNRLSVRSQAPRAMIAVPTTCNFNNYYSIFYILWW